MSGTDTPRPSHRPARSKDGCLTCRRRKVRCNEQKPRCSHCERLNLQCVYRSHGYAQSQRSISHASPNSRDLQSSSIADSGLGSPTKVANLASSVANTDGVFNDMFNYASFMWDQSDIWPSNQSSRWPGHDMMSMGEAPRNEWDVYSVGSTAVGSSSFAPTSTGQLPSPVPNYSTAIEPVGNQTVESQGKTDLSQEPIVPAETRRLIDYFIGTVVPPILAQVETQKRWGTMRQMLMSMSNTSTMVRWAILAFADMLYSRQSNTRIVSTQNYYEKAAAELSQLNEPLALEIQGCNSREHLLATLFFLSYIDLLEGKIKFAHANLKIAHEIFQQADKSRFRTIELRLLSWIRLLDARAVSAGGEGLFLSDDDEHLLAYPSPSIATETTSPAGDYSREGIEGVLFDVLYQPGFVFFQKIQSFMGRISKIDQWHRSRGTVEDETEVMSLACTIANDLTILYNNRPPLMHYAVAGSLAPNISTNLAFAITRAFRTYLSNYHASRIHLHRVAYKHLPLTAETLTAISTIRHLARLMVEGSETPDMLPVNMLWPLLMWGCEENDQEERIWIHERISNMEKVATNAMITAQVLQEVQKRQDAYKQRVDVRQVMHDIFDSCFAIV